MHRIADRAAHAMQQETPVPGAKTSPPRVSDTGVAAAQLASWLQQVASERSRDAFEGLFRHFAPRLLQYLLRTGSSRAAAEEFVQDTMTEIWLKAHLYKPERAAASTWVFTIARNLRIDRQRKLARQSLESLEDRHDTAADSALPCDIRMDAIDIVERFRQLPPDQSQVLELLYIDGLTQNEVSRRLSMPLGTVKSKVRLAFSKLRRALGVS
jgi:RNA polymerase sigma-70 factor (ECF subfamily)